MESGQIRTKRFKVNEFSVPIKIIPTSPSDGSLQDEREKYLQRLNLDTGVNINISELIGKERVTFIRGIAGIGKSVLAKQLVFGWASGILYPKFRLCIMFECRHLNSFHFTSGEPFRPKRKIFEAFLKDKFMVDFKDGKDVLFVVDGLDELYDVKEKDSIIYELLDVRNQHKHSKVIILGRPHVEDVVEMSQGNENGGCRQLEMVGLSEMEIANYMDKFAKCQNSDAITENVRLIRKTRESSECIRYLASVPQFLNTLCCVAILTEGQEVKSVTELYSWALFLFLKQHAEEKDQENSMKQIRVRPTFERYAKNLLNFSEIAYNLLRKNKIVFEKDEFHFVFDRVEEAKSPAEESFFQSFFSNVFDIFVEKFQFKHLTLMEFFSGIYCYSKKDKTQLIEELLKNESYEVLSFLCGFYGSLSEQNGIVKELAVAISREQSDDQSFIIQVLFSLWSPQNHVNNSVRLANGVRFICESLYATTNRLTLELISDIIKDANFCLFLSSDVTPRPRFPVQLEPTLIDQSRFITFFKALERSGFESREIAAHFGNVFLPCNVVNFDFLKYLKYFKRVDIVLSNQDISTHEIEIIVEYGMFCTLLTFSNCNFIAAERIEIGHLQRNHQRVIELLSVKSCKITKTGFMALAELFPSSKIVDLDGLLLDAATWMALAALLEAKKEESKFEKFQIHRLELKTELLEWIVKICLQSKEFMVDDVTVDNSFWIKLANAAKEMKDRGKLRLKMLKGVFQIIEYSVRQRVRY